MKVQYNNKNYKKELDKIDKNFDFIKENILMEGVDDEKIIIKPYFSSKDNTYFRYVQLDPDDYWEMPHEIMLIGNNDKTSTIYYIFFYDQDLDFYESNEDLLNNWISIDK